MSPESLLGLSKEHLSVWTESLANAESKARDWLMHTNMIPAWQAMVTAAKSDGIAITPVSSFRDYAHQQRIFNEKAIGARAVFDDDEQRLTRVDFSDLDWLHKILRFTALPGLSRHHWGTEIDVFNAQAIRQGYKPQLVASEFCNDGPCAPLNDWLNANAKTFGFYRPYQRDLGGVAAEPWHLSYQPLSSVFLTQIPVERLLQHYQQYPLELQTQITPNLPELMERYVYRINRMTLD